MARETMRNFRRRVFAATGVSLHRIPWGSDVDILGGHIFARRGNLYVVGIGYPHEDKDGTEIYSEFRRVRL